LPDAARLIASPKAQPLINGPPRLRLTGGEAKPWLCGVKATLKLDSETRCGAQKATRVVVTGPVTLLLQFAAAAGRAAQEGQ